MTEPYAEFTTEDFAADLYFCEWVLHPDEESNEFWRQFVLENTQQRRNIERAQAIVKAMRMSWTDVSDAEALRSYRDFQKHLQKQPSRWLAARRITLIAASVLCLLLAAGWLYVQTIPTVWQTQFGEVKTVQLPDGSAVTLNANSKLSYLDNWKRAGQRTVSLEGEAYFKVSHQDAPTHTGKQPVKFTVKSGGVDIEVVGTEFTVNNRRQRTQIALYNGIVRLQHPARDQPMVVMRPGETAEFIEGQKTVELQSKPSETRWVWKTNNLVFKAATLQQVAQTLEDNYGLQVVFEPETLAAQRFAGEVAEGKTDVLLTAVADAFGCQIRKENKRIIIYK